MEPTRVPSLIALIRERLRRVRILPSRFAEQALHYLLELRNVLFQYLTDDSGNPLPRPVHCRRLTRTLGGVI